MAAEQQDLNWYANEHSTFGDRVAVAREAGGLTQKALAKRLGVSAGTVEGWENDVREPRANKLQMLSGMLNVSITWLLTGEGEGIADAEVAADPGELSELMAEMRLLKSQMTQAADRIGVLEKRLRSAVADRAA